MEKTLITILNEGLSKMHLSSFPTYDEVPGSLFKTTIAVSFPSGVLFTGTGSGSKKKTSQHIAAGKLLLKFLDDDSIWLNFPFFEKMGEKAVAIQTIQSMIDNIENENGGTIENPISTLIAVCRQKVLGAPIFTCDEELASSLPQHSRVFHYTCQVDDYETVGEAPSKRNARARAADAMLSILAEICPKVEATPSHEPVFPILTSKVSPVLRKHSNGSTNSGVTDKVVFHLLCEIDFLISTSKTDDLVRKVSLFHNKGYFETIGKLKFLTFRHRSNAESAVLVSLHIVNQSCEKLEDALAKDIIDSFTGTGGTEKEAIVDAYKGFLHYVRNHYTYVLGYDYNALKMVFNTGKQIPA